MRSSSARSVRFVRNRTCGENGSGAAIRLRWAGVLMATRPPGSSTRRTSDRKSWTSRTCSRVSVQTTRSNEPSANGSGGVRLELDRVRAGQPRPRSVERNRRHVGERQPLRADRGRHRAVAASQVEGVPRRLERREPGTQVGRRDAVLRHELPQVVVIAAGHAGIMLPWRFAYSLWPRRPNQAAPSMRSCGSVPHWRPKGSSSSSRSPARAGSRAPAANRACACTSCRSDRCGAGRWRAR